MHFANHAIVLSDLLALRRRRASSQHRIPRKPFDLVNVMVLAASIFVMIVMVQALQFQRWANAIETGIGHVNCDPNLPMLAFTNDPNEPEAP